ncbi:hypothetical protein GCM10009710_37350 [Aeromicrobium alkaliterrae]|uniref:Uncharacterized protein n=1 Tax=Aeromicrobium alkaliterrae TaxID=302168 RepID=A0ABP4WHC2_9ACTN
MWFSRKHLDPVYQVDTVGLSRVQQIAACRAALEFVRPRADRLQLEVPWQWAESWPEDVVEAASILAPKREAYEVTGWVTPIEEHHWKAFVALAPFAFTADVWSFHMTELADVSNEATIIVVRIPPHDLARLRDAVAPARVT